MAVHISGMAYSPVEHELDNGDQWQSTIYPEETDQNLDLFKKYITEIIAKGDVADVTVGTFNSNPEPQRWLDTMKAEDCSDGSTEFKRCAKRLAEKLNDVIHPTANRGVLFAVKAAISGELIADSTPQSVIALLKLDLNEEVRLQLRDDHSLDTIDLEDVFPEPDELQKGVTYPVLRSEEFRLPGDVKFYQKDNVSGYFHSFLECHVESASLEQAKKVFNAISDIKRERTGQSADGDDLAQFKQLNEEVDDGIANINDITRAATEIVGDDVSAEDISQKLELDSPQALVIDTRELPNIVKYSIDREIEVKFPSSAEEQISKEENDGEVEVTIRGDELDIDALDK